MTSISAARRPISAQQLRAIMSETRDAACHCWRETEDKLPHSMATAWVIYVAGAIRPAGAPAEIDAILNRQGANGWWAMFPSTGDERNASTSATAWTALGAASPAEKDLIAPEQRWQVDRAVKSAAAWLIERALPDEARWTGISAGPDLRAQP